MPEEWSQSRHVGAAATKRPGVRLRGVAMTALALLLGAAMALWASTRVPLWPATWQLELWPWLLAALALHLPYTWLRALRLASILDPALEVQGSELPRRPLLASGAVSFFWLLVLPLRLGEFARPLLLARLQIPGLGMTEILAATLVERLVDAGTILLMLGAGLALSGPGLQGAGLSSALWASSILLLCGLAVAILLFVALLRWPEALRRSLARLPVVGGLVGQRVERIVRAVSGLRGLGPWSSLLAITLCYWGVTVVQAYCVAQACGLASLGLAKVAVLVAIVGLAIQLPAGPGQAGSYQAGNAAALSLILGAEVASSAMANQVATFVASTWLLGLLGAALFAVPGMLLLRRSGWHEAWATANPRKESRPTDHRSGE